MPALYPSLSSCLVTLTQSLCPILWRKAGEEKRKRLPQCVLLAHSPYEEKGAGERTCTLTTVCLHVCWRRHNLGKVTARVFSVVCRLGNNVTLTDDQWLVCFSKNYMRMVLKVSDRVLTSHRVHLMLLHTWGFFNWSIDDRVLRSF